MWIVCAGAKRSGSTLQYNILSRLVEETNLGMRIPHFKPDEFNTIRNTYGSKEGYKVIKAHVLTPSLQEVIDANETTVFHSYRDIRDVVVSYINKGWMGNENESISNCVSDYLAEYNSWIKLDTTIHSRKYEDFAFDLENEVMAYAEILQLDIDEEVAQRIAGELNLELLKKSQTHIDSDKAEERFNNKFHKDTLLHTNHIKDGSANQFLKELNGNQISLIESIAYHYLVDKGYALYWTQYDGFLSFAQHADDYIAWQLLGKKRTGVAVEVGAFDGLHLSNTCSFDQLGWHTVCLEPNPEIYKYLLANRPNAVNVNKAIVGTDDSKEIEFYSEEIGVLSGVTYDEEDIKKRYENRGLEYKEPKKLTVQAGTLSAILNEWNATQKKIDVISIDVEGFEMEVLKGLDLNEFDVKLFIIEANSEAERVAILKHFSAYPKYVHIGNNLQNLFIMKKGASKKKWMKQLEFENYFKVTQKHPVSEALSLNSVAPKFMKSVGFNKVQNQFKLF
ncbi:MAG: FkbM family methyltransferase [Bacteroidota bacterium]